MAQKPRHDDDGSYCPQWRKPCSKVCHTCEHWIALNVKDIRTGEQQDVWNCAKVWQVMLSVDIKQVTFQAGQAMESARNVTAHMCNEIVTRMDHVAASTARAQQIAQNGRTARQIEALD